MRSNEQGSHSDSAAGGEAAGDKQADAKDDKAKQRQMCWRRFNALTNGVCANAHGRADHDKVKAWQAEHGVAADGKVGKKTLAAARAGQKGAHQKAGHEASGHADAGKEASGHADAGQEAAGQEAAGQEAAGDDGAEKDAPDESEIPDEKAESGAHGHEGKKSASADPVEQVIEEITEHGITPEIEEKIEKKLTIEALEGLVEHFKNWPSADSEAVVAKIEHIKSEREEKKEEMQAPHGEKEKHLAKGKGKASFLQDEHGKEKKELSKEFTHDSQRNGSVSSSQTLTGEEAHEHQEETEKEEENEEKHKGKGRKFLESQHGTLKKGETEEHKEGLVQGTEAIEKKKEFGEKDGTGGDVHMAANEVKAKAGYEIGYSGSEGLTVEGNAGATATAVSGGAQIHTPPLEFSMGGEQFKGSFSFFVEAGILAEAKGKIALNLKPTSAGLEAEIGGFAGAKASIGATGQLEWMKRSPDAYVNKIVGGGGAEKLLSQILPMGVSKLIPESQYTSLMHRVVPILVGAAGPAEILGMTAKGEGSLGIGATAKFGAGFKGGKLHCSGKAGLTLGAGIGGAVDLELAMHDGLGLLAVLALMGDHHFENELQPTKSSHEFIGQQTRELISAIIEGCKEAEQDPNASWWVRQVLQSVNGTLGAIHMPAAGGASQP